MASQTADCVCVCERSPGGGCDCKCTTQIPCAFNAENKSLEWSCECRDTEGNVSCRCKFQVRCKSQDQSCCQKEPEVFECSCKCGGKECSMQVKKCQGCEVVRVDCECPPSSCCGGEKVPAVPAGGQCCKGGKC